LRGRRFLVPEDIYDVAPEILRHRVLLSYEALANGVKVDQIIEHVLRTIPGPRVAPHQDEAGRTAAAGVPFGAAQTAAGAAPNIFPAQAVPPSRGTPGAA
jgi:MoxR-like ATPase